MGKPKLQVVRKTANELVTYVGPEGEPVLNTGTKRPHFQDGATPGGRPLALLSDLAGLVDGDGNSPAPLGTAASKDVGVAGGVAGFDATQTALAEKARQEDVNQAIVGVSADAAAKSQAAIDTVRGGVAPGNDTLAKLAGSITVAAQGTFPAATKTQLDANTTALSGTVDSDGANNGTYARTVRNDPATAWVKTSSATVPALDRRVASQEGIVRPRSKAGTVAVTDERGNVALLSDRKAFKTPVLKTILRRISSGLAFTDEAGFALIHITKSAILHPAITKLAADIAAVLAKVPPFTSRARSSGSGVAFTDETGNVLLLITKTLFRHPFIDGLARQIAVLQSGISGRYDFALALSELVHIQIYGQSLSVGWLAQPPISTTPLSYADRFVGGVRPQDGGTDPAVVYASVAPLAEATSGSMGETPAYGCAQMIAQLLQAENGIDPATATQRFLMTTPGEASRGAGYLASPSNAPFQRLMDSITYGKLRGDGQSHSYGMGGLGFVQGETDYVDSTDPEVWKNTVRGLRTSTEVKANTVSGVSRTLPMFLCQTATHLNYGRATPGIALAQLALCDEKEFFFVTAKHMLQYNASDHVHMANTASKWLGAYYGLAIKRALFDGRKIPALIPDAAERNGSTLLLRFGSAVGGLVLDTTTCPNPGNFGFTLADAAGTPITVTSVSLVGADKVAIRAASALPSGLRVRNGWIGDGYRGLSNLRDRQGDFGGVNGGALIFDPTGINRPMHRWAPIFERTIL